MDRSSACASLRSALLTFVAVAGAGCLPGPRGPVDLRRAEVKLVRFGLRHARSAICPGEPVELDVAMEADLDDGGSVTLVQRRRDLDDTLFDTDQLYLESPQGRFEDGVFSPDADARNSLGSGFVVYARPPRGPAFAVRFPPYYECGGRIGGEGLAGRPGVDEAQLNAHNTEPRHFAEAIHGRASTTTIDGSDGGPGPRFTVFVTWVQTADYTKLLAGRAIGDVDTLTLVAPGYPLNIVAVGGRGGDGGRGQRGATGGSGGKGGKGGAGGDGGVVAVILDERYTDLARYVNVDVSGGPGGRPGTAGPGGDPIRAPVRGRKTGASTYEWEGTRGPPGPPGLAGPRGTRGSFTVRSGEVRSQLRGVAGLSVL